MCVHVRACVSACVWVGAVVVVEAEFSLDMGPNHIAELLHLLGQHTGAHLLYLYTHPPVPLDSNPLVNAAWGRTH